MFWDKLENRVVDNEQWKTLYSFENGYEEGIGNKKGLNESTYFTCLKIIADNVAKCTFYLKQDTDKGEIHGTDHYLYELLRVRPNFHMNAVTVFKSLVLLYKHYGMAGLYISRNSGKVTGLYPVRITGITIDDMGLIKSKMTNKILYDYQSVNGEYGSCFENDIIILRDFTLDGVHADATRQNLKEALDTSIKSQGYLNKLFQNGLTNKITVQLSSDIKEEGELKKVQEKFNKMFSSNGRIFTVPAGYNVSPLNLSLSDAQFAELRGMSKRDIAGSMGVPLSKIGEQSDNAKSNEQDNISFLTDTLQVIFSQIEQESDWKLLSEEDRRHGYKIRANVSAMLRLDAKTQADVITQYAKEGIYGLNHAKGLLGLEKLEKDVTTFPSGQVTLEQLVGGNISYMDSKQGVAILEEKQESNVKDEVRVTYNAKSVVISGYVNAVGRDSRVIKKNNIEFVEQIRSGVFEKALSYNLDIPVLLNHDKNKEYGNTSNGSLKLKENSVGLYAVLKTTDKDIVKLARNKGFEGWSFGFKATTQSYGKNDDGILRRYIDGLLLTEVSILTRGRTPAYKGTSIKVE